MNIVFEKHTYKSAKKTLNLKSAANLALNNMVEYGLDKANNDPKVIILFAVKQDADNNEVYVGAIMFKQYWEHKICELIAIFSDQKGLGTLLIIEMLKLKGKTYDLYVPSILTANGFYEKLGMTYLPEVPEYSDNDDYVDWYFWTAEQADEFLDKSKDQQKDINISRRSGY